MPTRRLPNSAASRLKAMRTGKDRKDAIPAPLVIPYSATTAAKLDVFYPAYKLKVEAVEAALQAQTNVTGTVKEDRQIAEWFISDFFSALQSAVRRKTFNASVRAYYGLAVNDAKVPVLNSEADIIFWGDKAAVGEAARIAAGGAAITFPAIAEVTAAVTNFKNQNLTQANAKDAYDAAQEALEADHADADKLILKMWNETEAAFDEGDKPSMRRKAREWGVVYVPNHGEKPNPDDFSIMGKVIDTDSGLVLNDVAVLVSGTDIIVLTDEQGKYLIPVLAAGTYSVTAYKPGYQVKLMPNVTVAEGEITSLDIAMQANAATGTVSGTVKQMGVGAPAKVSVDGTTLTVDTDGAGNYTINNVPVGSQTISAKLNGGGGTQSQNVNVTAGATTPVDFNF